MTRVGYGGRTIGVVWMKPVINGLIGRRWVEHGAVVREERNLSSSVEPKRSVEIDEETSCCSWRWFLRALLELTGKGLCTVLVPVMCEGEEAKRSSVSASMN